MPLLDYYTDTNVTARPHLVAPQGRLSAYTQADLIKQGWETVELNLLNADGNARVGSISTPLGHLGIRQDQFHVLKHLHNKQSFRNGQSYPVSIDTPLSYPLTTFAIGHLSQRRNSHLLTIAFACQATGARFMNAYNPRSGTIVAMDNMSPTKRAVQRRMTRDQLPTLRYWSDVVWLEWTRLCQLEGISPSQLNYVIQYQILNTVTLQVIFEILHANGLQLGCWPGVTFDVANLQGSQVVADIMATPLGAGINRLLLQHERTLGYKRVRAITLFNAGSDWHPEACLLFSIA